MTETMAMPSPNLGTRLDVASASGGHAQIPGKPKEEQTHRELTVSQHSTAFTRLTMPSASADLQIE